MSAPRPKAALIAIVEDDRAVLNSLEFALQSEGYAVCGFERWADAMASPQVLEADCLVIDYAMPGLTGVALLDRLRANGLACPAIVIASNPGPRCRREVQSAGAPLVEKPLLDGALGAHIRAALAGAKSN
jgi:two-component system response regulator FixJ